jgi:beta-1,4-N-acetylglucosaminyltransferase
MKKKDKPKVCLISSSGGHYEQLKRLKPLGEKYNVYFVTEKTYYKSEAKYHLFQGRPTKIGSFFILILNSFKSLGIWIKERPDYVVTTGTMVALPTLMLAMLFHKKTIYIETFARIYDGTKAGKFFYGKTDLFLYQWETLKEIYPDGVFGGSIY